MADDKDQLKLLVEVLQAERAKRQLQEIEGLAERMTDQQKRAALEISDSNSQASESIADTMARYGQFNQVLEIYNRIVGLSVAAVQAFTEAMEHLATKNERLGRTLDDVRSEVQGLSADFASGVDDGGRMIGLLENLDDKLEETGGVVRSLGNAFDFVVGHATNALGNLVSLAAAIPQALAAEDPLAAFREIWERNRAVLGLGAGGESEMHRRMRQQMGVGGGQTVPIEETREFREAQRELREEGRGESLPGVGELPFGVTTVDPWEEVLTINEQAAESARVNLEIVQERGEIMRRHMDTEAAVEEETARQLQAMKQGGGGGGGAALPGAEAEAEFMARATESLFPDWQEEQQQFIDGVNAVRRSIREAAMEEFDLDAERRERDQERHESFMRWRQEEINAMKEFSLETQRMAEQERQRFEQLHNDAAQWAKGIATLGTAFASVFDRLAESEEEGSEEAKKWGRVKGGVLAAVAFVQSAIEYAAGFASIAEYQYGAAASHFASAIAYDVAGALALSELGGSAASAPTSGQGSYVPSRPEEEGVDTTGGGTTVVIQTYGMESTRMVQHMNDASRKAQRSGVDSSMLPAGGYR